MNFWEISEPAFQSALNYKKIFMPDPWRSKMERLLLFAEQAPSLMSVVSPPGHCKSTMAHWVFKSLDQSTHEVQLLSLYQEEFEPGWLLPKLCKFLGVEYSSRLQGVEAFTEAVERISLGHRVLTIIIDESHKLKSPDAMQEIHTLISMQSLISFNINFVLLGSPQVMNVIHQTPEFYNRHSLAIHLEALTREELMAYLSYRLREKKIPPTVVLPDTVDQILQITGGIFSRVNALMENSLIEAYLRNTRTIDLKIVNLAAQFLPNLQASQFPVGSGRATGVRNDSYAKNDKSLRRSDSAKPSSKSVEISSLFYKSDKK